MRGVAYLALEAHFLGAELLRIQGVEVGEDLASEGLVELKHINVLVEDETSKASGVKETTVSRPSAAETDRLAFLLGLTRPSLPKHVSRASTRNGK